MSVDDGLQQTLFGSLFVASMSIKLLEDISNAFNLPLAGDT